MVQVTSACSYLLQTRSRSPLLMEFVTHSTWPHLGAARLPPDTVPRQNRTKQHQNQTGGAVGSSLVLQAADPIRSSNPDLILSVWEDTRITVWLLPTAMHVIEGLNYAGRRIWVGENVLTWSVSGLVILFLDEGGEGRKHAWSLL